MCVGELVESQLFFDRAVVRSSASFDIMNASNRGSQNYLQRLVDREAELPTRCDNGWTRTLLVLASIWVGITAYARSCQVATACVSTFGRVQCTPFTLGGALSACSVRACALKSQGSNDLVYMSNVLKATLGDSATSTTSSTSSSVTSATSATSVAAMGALSSSVANSIKSTDGGMLRNTKWLDHAFEGASQLSTSASDEVKLRNILDWQERQSCSPGQSQRSSSTSCTSIATTPYGLTLAAMDTDTTLLETRACGVWSKAVRTGCGSCARQYFTLQSGVQNEEARWRATFERLQLRGGSRGPAGTLMGRCVALRREGTASIAATMHLSYRLLRARMPPLTTISNVLRAIGQLSGYGCNSLVRVGPTVDIQGVSVQLANMAPASNIAEALQMVNEDDALRKSLVMREVLSLSPVMTSADGFPIESLWENTGLTTANRDEYDACYLENIGYLDLVFRSSGTDVEAWHMEQILYGVRGVGLQPDEQALFKNGNFEGLVYLKRLLCLLHYDDATVPGGQLLDAKDRSLGAFGKEVATAVVQSSVAMCVRSLAEAVNEGLGGSATSGSTGQTIGGSTGTTTGTTTGSAANVVSFGSSALGRVHPLRQRGSGGEHAVGLRINATRFEDEPRVTREALLSAWKQPTVMVVGMEEEAALERQFMELQNAPHHLVDAPSVGEAPDVFDEVMRSPTRLEYTKSALVTVNDLRTNADPNAYTRTMSQCGALVRFVAPISMDRAAFRARFTKRILTRLEGLFESLRTQMIRTVRGMSTLFKDVSLIENAFLNVKVNIPGATRDDSIMFGGGSTSTTVDTTDNKGNKDNTDAYESQWQIDASNGAFRTDDGVLLNMLDSARATKRILLDHAVSDDIKDPCELPPLYDAQIVNAYYLYPSNCIVMFLGMATDNILNDGYDDSTLLSRYVWVLAHELAHASTWSRRFQQPYELLLSLYGPNAKEEGLADILAAIAVTKAAGLTNAYTILLNVAQVFCVSNAAPLPLVQMFGSHPPSSERATLACTSIQLSYERDEIDVNCVPPSN